MKSKQVLIAAFVVLSMFAAGCLKSDSNPSSNCTPNTTGVPTAAEVSAVQAHLTANSITATQHPSGLFYKINVQGTGATPTATSRVTVKYTGKLTNGSVFDQNTTGTTFTLNQLITGWQIGLPLIQKGGSIDLYLPPTLGYGCNSVGGIPAGSITIFNIELIDVL